MKAKIITTQRVLSPTQISLAEFTINPYRGCSFGCLYCYTQSNKNIKKNDFQHTLRIKINSPDILKKELETKKPKRVLLGSTTECFQEIEKKYKITEKILKILNDNNIAYTILTKSALIKNYLELISENKNNQIYFTLNLASQKSIDLLEKRSSALSARLAALSEIIQKNIDLRIHVGPFIPYLSSIKNILNLIPPKVNKINIELYHNKTGNFKKLLEQIKINFGKETANQLSSVYENKENYLDYTKKIKDEIIKLKQTTAVDFFYIVPDYDLFYKSSINYNNPI